jgi:uncharacterized membrane protein YozB (DUF420 family)
VTAPLLPTINAGFNALSAALLTAGFLFIRKKNVAAHRRCMTGAFLSSVLNFALFKLTLMKRVSRLIATRIRSCA